MCGVPAARAKTGASARALPRGSRATETALCSRTRPAARRFGSAQRFLNQTLSVHEAPVLSFPVVNDAPCWRNSITYLLILLLIDECHSLFFFFALTGLSVRFRTCRLKYLLEFRWDGGFYVEGRDPSARHDTHQERGLE